MKFKSIANRIFALVIPTITITIFLFAILSYYVSNSRINATINEKMYESLQAADLEIQLELYKNTAVALNFASYAKTLNLDTFDHDKNNNILAETILSNPNTFGGGVWFEPYVFDKDSYYFGPFLYVEDNGETIYIPNYGDTVDYFNEDWYIKGLNSNGELVWSKVYYDPVSTRTMVTATKPFFDAEGKFIGVGTADMNLENIRRIVNKIRVGKTGKAFILGSNGEYISFYGEAKSVNNTMQTDEDETLARLGKELVENGSGITTLVRNGKKSRVYYMTMDNVNWNLAVAVDESEINSSTMNLFIVMTIIPVLGLLFVIVGIFMIAGYLRKIVNKVNNFADLAASGDFSKRIEVTELDEFGLMEQRLNIMISNMSDMSNHSAELLKIAENASKSKSEFLSRMSHEIRTPMNAIIGMTQIAKTSDDSEKINDCLNKIDNASKHLLALINDILDMSKIEANKLELSEEEFNLAQSLMDIYDMMLVKAEEKNQRLTLNIGKNAPTYIIGDELRLSQVVTNLIGNAIKFTPDNGSIAVDMMEEDRDGKNSLIKISVRDSGIGISPEQQAQLFKSFEQGDGSISRRFGGTGLGLAISKHIVDLMGGDIRVTSEPGKGSNFTVTIKVLVGSGIVNSVLNTIDELTSDKIKDNYSKIDLSKVGFSGYTLLLVDDIEINREIVAAFLEHTKVNIEFAENGIQATEMFRSSPDKYDLILMDVQMPEMDGFDATRQIRNMDIKRAKTIPIIAMTANALSEDVEKCKAAGMTDHVAKPIEPDTLLIKLNDYFFMKDYLNQDS